MAPGASFTIDNKDGARHTFTSVDSAWPELSLPPDSSTPFTVPQDLVPGDYSFFCAFHPDSMGGRLVVTG